MGFIAPPPGHWRQVWGASDASASGCSNTPLRRRGRSNDNRRVEGVLCKIGRLPARSPRWLINAALAPAGRQVEVGRADAVYLYPLAVGMDRDLYRKPFLLLFGFHALRGEIWI